MNDQPMQPLNGEEITSGLPATLDQKSTLAIAIARQEIDQQITTAKSYPRSIAYAVQRIKTLATLDDETAKECVYALKRGGTMLNGPSIRFAEIVASQWGNLRSASRVIFVDRFEGYVEAEAVCHDLETNYAKTARARRRIKDKHGRVYADDMILVTGQAACSIAERNAILACVAKGVWRQAYYAVTSVVAGDVKTIAARRSAAVEAFGKVGVTPEQLFEAIGVRGLDDIGLDEIVTLIAMHKALKEGEQTIEEMFPPKRNASAAPKGADAKLDALARGERVDAKTGEILPENSNPDAASQAPGFASEQGQSAAGGRAGPSSRVSDGPAHDSEAAPPKRASAAPAQEPAREAENQVERAAAPAPAAAIDSGPRVGDDPARDEATLADLRAEGERRATEGSQSFEEFESDLTAYEVELIQPVIGALRRKARQSDRKAGGAQ